jgi:hypothetical protein
MATVRGLISEPIRRKPDKGATRCIPTMNTGIEPYLATLSCGASPVVPPAASDLENDGALEQIIGQKSKIQARKLEILAAELRWRLLLAAQNLHTLDRDQSTVHDLLNQLTIDANYRLRDHQEKAPLYRRIFEIETEKRSQHVECWRDMANVMRDFLAAWEAHEQARSRAIFLNDVGSGTQEPL